MQIPETGFLRESQILGQREITAEEARSNRELGNNRPRRPRSASPALLPISHASWWRGTKEGKYPQPIKLSARVTAWRVEDIRRLIANGIA